MSFNKIPFDANGQPILFEDESPQSSYQKVAIEYGNGGGFPGQGESFHSPLGSVILTNLRLLYIPAKKGYLQSLAVPLQNLQDGKLNSNWIKGSTYTAAVKSVPDDGFSKEWGKVRFQFDNDGTNFQAQVLHLRSRLGELPAIPADTLPIYDPGESSSPVYAEAADDKPPTYQ